MLQSKHSEIFEVIRGAVAVMATSIALAISLVGCGTNLRSNFEGMWTILEMTSDEYSTVTAYELSERGYVVTLTLNEDGSGTFNVIDRVIDFNWDAESATQIRIENSDGESNTMTLADNVLTAESNGFTFTFKKDSSSDEE